LTVNSILWSLPNTYFKGLKLDVNWCYAVYCNDRLALLIKLTPYTLHLSALWVVIDPPFKYAVFFFSHRGHHVVTAWWYFIQFSQYLTCYCLLISAFPQKFTWADPKIVLNKQLLIKFWLNWIEYGAVSYSLSCTQAFLQNIY
jgi:hypothetical protein